MNILFAVPLVLLVILASLFYLIKVKNENHGNFFKWGGYLVLLAAIALLACMVFKGVKKRMHRSNCEPKEMMHMKKSMKMKGGMMDKCSGMENCSGMNKMACSNEGGMGDGCCSCCGGMEMMGKGDMKSHGDHMTRESSTDTIDGKIIKREVEIIKK